MVKQQNSWAPRFASYAYGRESYLNDPEKRRAWNRESYMKDPEKSRGDSAARLSIQKRSRDHNKK